MKKINSPQAPSKNGVPSVDSLVGDIRELIEETRSAVAVTVNAGLTLLYWRIGVRIREDILGNERAGYGDEIVSTLSRQLTIEYGRGFSEKSLRHMIRFAEAFQDERIVSALMRQLSWTHFLSVIYLPDPLQRDFYVEMCRVEKWSTRTLQKRIHIRKMTSKPPFCGKWNPFCSNWVRASPSLPGRSE